MRTAELPFDSNFWGEPTLDALLADPIVHAMMRRDGVDEAGVRAVVARAAEKARQGAAPAGS